MRQSTKALLLGVGIVFALGVLEVLTRIVKKLYESSGFQVHSFFDIFRELDMRDYGYNPEETWSHFSDAGNDFIGKALAEYIDANHFVLRRWLNVRSASDHRRQNN